MLKTRRVLLWGSASTMAVAAAVYATPFVSKLGAQTSPTPPVISFAKAKGSFLASLKESMAVAQKELDVKYTPEQFEDIQNRTWDSAQVILSRHYEASETPKELQDLRR
jgi:hypothetical protein